MKQLLILTFTLLTAAVFSQKDYFIKEDWEQARKLAKEQDKILFVDFYTDW